MDARSRCHPPTRSGRSCRRERSALRAAAITWGILLAGAAPAPDEPAPADLRLEWPDGTRERGPLRGPAGETVRVPYVVRNVGGRDAWAAMVASHTALGRLRPEERVSPGPAAGRHLDRELRMALAKGMRELCLEVRLQTLRADEPPDPNRGDNRLCCAIEIETDPGADRTTVDPARSSVHSSGDAGKGESSP